MLFLKRLKERAGMNEVDDGERIGELVLEIKLGDFFMKEQPRLYAAIKR